MRQRLFGTDGMRGRFGAPPLDRRTVTALGYHLARWLIGRSTLAGPTAVGSSLAGPAAGASTLAGPAPDGSDEVPAGDAAARRGASGRAPSVVLGGDTRESTPELCGWIAAGLAAGGATVRYAGVIPTPGVSYLAARLGAAAGVVVSASHNPYPDNGVKLLDALGRKWTAEDEAELEDRLLADLSRDKGAGAMLEGTGEEPAVEPGLRELYLRHLAATVRAAGEGRETAITEPPPDEAREGSAGGDRGEEAANQPLAGLRVVLDAGNGAASHYAGELFEDLGAEVVRLLCAAPDGRNVNLDCGSTAPESMAAATAAAAAHLGIAFDGDADRCILADERGVVRDGDAILYLWATSLLAQGLLAPPRIVATSMSNLGLERALARHGIGVVRCGVGDRAVVETMRREGILLGGEQSGHIVRLDLAATGDGLLTAVQIAAIARGARSAAPADPGSAADTGSASRAARPLSELLAGFRRYPQILLNVPVAHKPDLTTVPRVAAAARGVERDLGADGRLVLRYSGTEPLARIMIEGPDQATIETLAARLAAVLAEELGNPAP